MLLVLALASLAFPAFVVPCLVSYSYKTGHVVGTAIALGIALGVVALAINHDLQGDLSRYIMFTDSCKGIPISSLGTSRYSEFPLAALFFWLLANSCGPYALSFFVAFAVYSCLSYIVLDFARSQRLGLSRAMLGMAAMLCTVSLLGSVNSVRSTLALSIGFLGLYLDVYRGKRLPLLVPLYVVPILIHVIGLVCLAIRIALPLARRHPLAAAVTCALGLPLALLAAQNFHLVIPFTGMDVSEVLVSYSEWNDTGWAAAVANSPLQRVQRFINVLIIGQLLVVCYPQAIKGPARTPVGDLFACLLMCGCLTIGIDLLITSDVYLRLAYVVEPMLAVLALPRLFPRESGNARPGISVFGAVFLVLLVGLLAVHLRFLMADSAAPYVGAHLLFGIFPLLVG